MKILVIDNSVKTTGAYKSIVGVASNLSNIDFTFLTPSETHLDHLLNHGFRGSYIRLIEIQKSWKILLYLPQLLFNTFKVLKFLKTLQIDVLHVNDLYNMIGVLVKIIRPKTRVVYHVRLLPNSYAARLYFIWIKLILKYADKVICVSSAVSQSLPDSPKKFIIYDGVEEVLLKPVTKVENKIQFLYPANYIEGKGQFHAMEAFSQMKKSKLSIELRFVGGDMGLAQNARYREKLAKRSEQLGLNEFVKIDGFSVLLNDDIMKSDIILMFSESESFSMICVEAAMCGMPVIATRCGGPEEIIEHNRTGLLVDKGDVGVMTKAMNELACDVTKRQQLGKMARERCISKFSVEKSANDLLKVYQSIQ